MGRKRGVSSVCSEKWRSTGNNERLLEASQVVRPRSRRSRRTTHSGVCPVLEEGVVGYYSLCVCDRAREAGGVSSGQWLTLNHRLKCPIFSTGPLWGLGSTPGKVKDAWWDKKN